jgi:hypothetical protein
MTTFKEIRGTTIEVVSSDPANPETGQIWYNSSSGTLKGYLLANVNAWSAGGNLNTARSWIIAAQQGTQTAALVIGGDTTGSGGITGATESYNGSTWTTLNPASNLYERGGAGTQTAALVFGGHLPQSAATESFNGTTWTSGTSLPTPVRTNGGVGTQTAAISFGGGFPVPSIAGATNKYNGTSWTASGTMPTIAYGMAVAGTQTAALTAAGGNDSGVLTYAATYNGTSWTAISSTNTARDGLAGAGTQTLAIIFGGSPGVSTTELWNGTSWTTNPTGLATSRSQLSGCGTQTAALAAGGDTGVGVPLAATEEWTGQALRTRTITVS